VKLRKLEELPSLLAGKKTVLANGCFDILHVGHVRYLEGARQLGDVLVVAVNSDRSVLELKGPGRPILNETERVALVSALRSVDHVVIFDEADLGQVIDTLRPSIHARGTDSTVEAIPERESVAAHGGQMKITGDPKNHSSKDVIRRIEAMHQRNG